MKITVEGLGVRFHKGVEVLRDVSFEVPSGEFLVLVGPGGCGKSTLLNAIAGLIPADEATVTGRILVDGADMHGRRDRIGSLGYVFQRDILFPWRTVIQNVESGLEIRGMPRAKRAEIARRLIDVVGLSGFEHTTLTRSPAECGSGRRSSGLSRTTPKSSSWTSPSAPSTRRPG